MPKNRASGLASYRLKNKVVPVFHYESFGNRCHVYVLDLYFSKISLSAQAQDVFYLRLIPVSMEDDNSGTVHNNLKEIASHSNQDNMQWGWGSEQIHKPQPCYWGNSAFSEQVDPKMSFWKGVATGVQTGYGSMSERLKISILLHRRS